MDDLAGLLSLFETFKEGLSKAAPSQRSEAIKKATKALAACVKLLELTPKRPTQKALKEQLLTEKTALKIRACWQQHKAIIDLGRMATEIGLKLKKPSIDHLIIAYYYPINRLQELATKVENIAANNPACIETKRFQEWRGELRAMNTLEQIGHAVQCLAQREGTETMRRFAVHLNTRDLSGKKRLAKNASPAKLVEAVSSHLWREKVVSEVQEGRR